MRAVPPRLWCRNARYRTEREKPGLVRAGALGRRGARKAASSSATKRPSSASCGWGSSSTQGIRKTTSCMFSTWRSWNRNVGRRDISGPPRSFHPPRDGDSEVNEADREELRTPAALRDDEAPLFPASEAPRCGCALDLRSLGLCEVAVAVARGERRDDRGCRPRAPEVCGPTYVARAGPARPTEPPKQRALSHAPECGRSPRHPEWRDAT